MKTIDVRMITMMLLMIMMMIMMLLMMIMMMPDTPRYLRQSALC